MYDLIDSFFIATSQPSGRYQSRLATKSRKTAEGCEIELIAPGLSRSDFKVTVINDILTVKIQPPECQGNGNLREQMYNKTQPYAWKLSDTVLSEQITACYDAGILTVSIPVKYQKSNKIEIKVA